MVLEKGSLLLSSKHSTKLFLYIYTIYIYLKYIYIYIQHCTWENQLYEASRLHPNDVFQVYIHSWYPWAHMSSDPTKQKGCCKAHRLLQSTRGAANHMECCKAQGVLQSTRGAARHTGWCLYIIYIYIYICLFWMELFPLPAPYIISTQDRDARYFSWWCRSTVMKTTSAQEVTGPAGYSRLQSALGNSGWFIYIHILMFLVAVVFLHCLKTNTGRMVIWIYYNL